MKKMILLNKLIFFCCIFFVSSCVESNDQCNSNYYINEIKYTESLIIKGDGLLNHNGLLKGKLKYSCVVISFSINDDGKAFDYKLEEFFPNKIMLRLSSRSIKNYEFFFDGTDRRGYLFFEIRNKVNKDINSKK